MILATLVRRSHYSLPIVRFGEYYILIYPSCVLTWDLPLTFASRTTSLFFSNNGPTANEWGGSNIAQKERLVPHIG